MWPTGKWCWRGQTRLRSRTNIHICLLHKSPEYHLRIPVLGNCFKHHFTHNAHARSCQSFRFSYKKTVLHMTGRRMLCSAQFCLCTTETQKCHRYVDTPYFISALTVTYITPTTEWITAFTRMRDETFFLKYGAQMCAVTLNSSTNRTMRSQTKACITKSPYVICVLVRY